MQQGKRDRQFYRADLEVHERISRRQQENSFYNNPVLLEKQVSAQKIRAFKEASFEHRTLLEKASAKDLMSMDLKGAALVLQKKVSKKELDPEKRDLRRQLTSSMKHLESLKDELFPTQIDLMGTPYKNHSPKRDTDYYFEKFEYMHHNEDLKKAIADLAASPDSQTIGGEFQVVGEPLFTTDLD